MITDIEGSQESFVFLPGLTGGGKYLTALRQTPDLFVPSSISTKPALKKGEKSTKEHYENLVREIIQTTGDKELYLLGHSLGGFEAIDILNILIDNPDFKNKKVNLVFISTPGFTDKGIRGFIEFGKRFRQINKKVALNEQHTTYPLPEKFYETAPQDIQDANISPKVAFKDSPEEREQRRYFFKDALKPQIIPKGKTKEQIITELNNIDKQISGEIESKKTLEDLLRERAMLLHPVIEALFAGKQIDDEIHQKALELYQELPENLASSLRHYISTLLYLARAGKHIAEGTGKQLQRVLEKAKSNDVDVNISFILLERDEMIKIDDIAQIKQNFKQGVGIQEIDKTVSFLLMEQLAHSSIGYYPKPIADFMTFSLAH